MPGVRLAGEQMLAVRQAGWKSAAIFSAPDNPPGQATKAAQQNTTHGWRRVAVLVFLSVLIRPVRYIGLQTETSKQFLPPMGAYDYREGVNVVSNGMATPTILRVVIWRREGFRSGRLTSTGPYPTIASLSLGTRRTLWLRDDISLDDFTWSREQSCSNVRALLRHNYVGVTHSGPINDTIYMTEYDGSIHVQTCPNALLGHFLEPILRPNSQYWIIGFTATTSSDGVSMTPINIHWRQQSLTLRKLQPPRISVEPWIMRPG
ncbi:hypothetical protein EDB83DRAFT_2315226 [Lactarius deliciosus]|nr:hypothetical protein EDB83DRAFT_2315226 [Lactarius deliciosus]